MISKYAVVDITLINIYNFFFRTGRKLVFYIAIVMQITCGVLLPVAPTWWIFAILK